jgi:hypothetical protein
MTATQPDLFSGWEAATDEDVAEYPALTDAHLVAHCRCGRLVLTGLPGAKPGGPLDRVIAARGFKVTDTDDLPAAAFRWQAVRGRRVAVCCACAVAERRANRGRA